MLGLKRVGILGGGITGLSSCHFLHRRGPPARPPPPSAAGLPAVSRFSNTLQSIQSQSSSVLLFEKEQNPGGWISTSFETVPGRRILFEGGPRSLRVAKANDTFQLIEDLGLIPDVIPSSPLSSKRLLYIDSQIQALPASLNPFAVLASPVLRPQIIPILKEMFGYQPKSSDRLDSDNSDESIAAFFERHFGVAFTAQLIAPMISGIYAGSIHKLSIQSCFPSLVDLERKHGSIGLGFVKSAFEALTAKETKPAVQQSDNTRKLIKNLKRQGGIFTFKDGLSTLPYHIASLHRENIVQRAKIQRIERDKSTNTASIVLEDGRVVSEFTNLISALPAFELATLVEPYVPEAAKLLNSIEHANVGVVSLVFDKPADEVIPKELQGFGYLVPPNEKQRILGVVFDSVTFPAHNSSPFETRMTVMIGGDPSAAIDGLAAVDVATESPEALLEIALRALKRHLQLDIPPRFYHVHRHLNCIPQYHVGHKDKVKRIRVLLAEGMPELVVAGAAFDGVSVNDCITSGRNAANAVLEKAR